MKSIKHHMDWLDKNRNLALGLVSDPGMGKTSMINQWAQEHGRDVFSLVVSQRSPTEVSGMAMPNNDTQKMCVYDFDTLLNLKDGDILFLDEFGNGNPMTINATLTVVLDRMLPSGRKLNDILVVAATNPQGCTMFTPQVKQRFVWKDVIFNSKIWVQYMMSKHDMIPVALLEDIATSVRQEKFEKNYWNYLSPRSADILIQLLESDPDSMGLRDSYKPSNEYNYVLRRLLAWKKELAFQVLFDIKANAPELVCSPFFWEIRSCDNDREVRKVCKEYLSSDDKEVIAYLNKGRSVESEQS